MARGLLRENLVQKEFVSRISTSSEVEASVKGASASKNISARPLSSVPLPAENESRESNINLVTQQIPGMKSHYCKISNNHDM